MESRSPVAIQASFNEAAENLASFVQKAGILPQKCFRLKQLPSA
jgi:hypothetical protein